MCERQLAASGPGPSDTGALDTATIVIQRMPDGAAWAGLDLHRRQLDPVGDGVPEHPAWAGLDVPKW
jgi:hypothetical protein